MRIPKPEIVHRPDGARGWEVLWGPLVIVLTWPIRLPTLGFDSEGRRSK